MAGIQTIPAGLLGLLNLKTQGKNPSLLLPEVRPVLDLLQFFLAGPQEVVIGAFNGAVIGDNAVGPLVPQNEVWFVRHVVAEADALGVGEIIVIAPSYRPNDLVTVPLTPTDDSVRFAGTAGLPRVSSQDPFIAPANSQFGVFVPFLSGAVNVQCTVVMVRARI